MKSFVKGPLDGYMGIVVPRWYKNGQKKAVGGAETWEMTTKIPSKVVWMDGMMMASFFSSRNFKVAVDWSHGTVDRQVLVNLTFMIVMTQWMGLLARIKEDAGHVDMLWHVHLQWFFFKGNYEIRGGWLNQTNIAGFWVQ